MLTLSAPEKIINAKIKLSGSKSINNRLLILNEVLDLNLTLQNNSTSEDTLLLQKALQQIKNKTNATIDIHHAGTDMRFLTAFLAIKKGDWILTGSERMKERPEPRGGVFPSLIGLGGGGCQPSPLAGTGGTRRGREPRARGSRDRVCDRGREGGPHGQ